MTRREQAEEWAALMEDWENISNPGETAAAAELRALWANEARLQAVVDAARKIDGVASGDEWWCKDLAAALDALDNRGGDGNE